MKILIVEDNTDCMNYFMSVLKPYFMCDFETNGLSAITALKHIQYNFLILDFNIPLMNGLDVIKKVRQDNISIPIIVISANHRMSDKINALNIGADDYLTKPYDQSEFLARINSIARRYNGFSSSLITYGDISINTSEKIVLISGKEVIFTKKELILLELLISKRGGLVSKDTMLQELYPKISDQPIAKILDVFACKIRTKLKKANSFISIQTIWSRGWQLKNSSYNTNHLNLHKECQLMESAG